MALYFYTPVRFPENASLVAKQILIRFYTHTWSNKKIKIKAFNLFNISRQRM